MQPRGSHVHCWSSIQRDHHFHGKYHKGPALIDDRQAHIPFKVSQDLHCPMAGSPKFVSLEPFRYHSLIFVTVGTTMPFDELLKEVDLLASEGVLGEDVICQGGQSSYRMSHGEQFMGRPSIDDLIERSSTVITHGGSTVIQLLIAGKPFVAFPNPRGAGDHQTSFLEAIARASDISWSRNIKDLHRLLNERRTLGSAIFPADFPRAGNVIRETLKSGFR